MPSTLTFSGTPLNADVGAVDIIITASDGSLSASDTFTLTVINTNDDPTAIILLSNNVDENINGAVVGDISTSDVDASDKHVYTLSGDDASFFEVINGQLKFKNSFSANYETQDSYEVSVTSTDLAGSAFSQSFSININDVNDAPTQLTLSASVLDENSEGIVIGTVSSLDEDGDDVSYALSGPYGYYFEIVEDQLKLKENFSANFEANNTLSFTINATDSKGLVTSKNFTITVNDVNDAPSSIQLSANSLKNNSEGANVGKVLVVDDDNNETFTYAINDDRFEIVDGVLKLKTDQSINYDSEPSVTLEITVTDSQGAEFSQTLTVASRGS